MRKVDFSTQVRILVVCLSLLSISTLFAQFAGGTGSQEDPYQVANATHLNNVHNYLNACFIQINDINLGEAPYNQGTGWNAIGTFINDTSTANIPFQGIYDGNGFSINNLMINKPYVAGQGLFAYTNDAIISNLNLNNVTVSGGSNVGSLIATSVNTVLVHCTSSGALNGTSHVGGLIGKSTTTNLTDCSFQGHVTGSYHYTGGLIAYSQSGNISNCHTSGIVTGDSEIGGLLGAGSGTNLSDCYSVSEVQGAILSSDGYDIGGLVGVNYYVATSYSRCFASGNVSGSGHMGGFGGHLDLVTISDCYSTGDVTWNANATYSSNGGFIGVDQACIISNCYASGLVNTGPSTYVGGFIGNREEQGVITNSYWNSETSGHTYSDGGEGRNTAQMTFPFDTNTYIGWDFVSIWNANNTAVYNNGYPFLRSLPYMVAAPSITPPSDNYDSAIEVIIQSLTDSALIYYTLDGSEPTQQSTLYTAPFTISNDTTIKARAYKEGWVTSGASTTYYHFTTAGNDNVNTPLTLSCNVYPNPFYPDTTISFNLPKAAHASLDIYNLKGQKICSLANTNFSKGEHSYKWDGRTDEGEAVPCGMYLYKLKGYGFEITHKMTLMR